MAFASKNDDIRFNFRLLLVDETGSSKVKTEKQLLHSVIACNDVSLEGTIGEKELSCNGLDLIVNEVKPDSEVEDEFKLAFVVDLDGGFNEVEKRRLPLIEHFKHQHFSLIYALKDGVSEKISCDLYPHLYRVENALRGYITRFMVTRIGPKWWLKTAQSEYGNKVQRGKENKNETKFSPHLQFESYYIDFGDIGKIVYSHSSGFLTKDDVIKQINNAEESKEGLLKLKVDMQSNYKKFFLEAFGDGFQNDWQEFEKLRHKIAHTSLFTLEDLEKGKELGENLFKIISDADESVKQYIVSSSERASLRESIAIRWNGYEEITEEEFITELRSQENYFHPRSGYVGKHHFVRVHLGTKGFDYSSSYAMCDHLVQEGKVELYQAQNRDDELEDALRSSNSSATT